MHLARRGVQRPLRAPYARLPAPPRWCECFTPGHTYEEALHEWLNLLHCCDGVIGVAVLLLCPYLCLSRSKVSCFSLLSCLLVSVCCFGIKLVLVNLRKYVSSLTARALERTEEICSGVRPLTAGSSLHGNTVSHQRGVLFAPGVSLCHNHLQVGGACYRQIALPSMKNIFLFSIPSAEFISP